MKLDFIRFETSDHIELQGWLSNTDGETAVIHMHGMVPRIIPGSKDNPWKLANSI